MSAVFRHITIRLWITALAGGLMCTVLLPLWHRMMGLDGLWLPVLAVMTGCFVLCGFVMNRFGLSSIRRQITEATVWERAGMSAEAENAFEKAKAAYDGFWLSPLQRRRSADWILQRLARFCLAQSALGNAGRAIVLSYLQIHPEDEAVALGWLETALQGETRSHDDHEAADRINEAWHDHEKIQRLLMQFYLSDERSDFEAMQTYRRVWQWGNDLPRTLTRKIARLLLNETCLNDWALQVYLKGYDSGDADCLEGLAASIQWLRPNAENRHDLAEAERTIAGLDEAQRRKLIRPSEPRMPMPAGAAGEKSADLRMNEPGRQERLGLMRIGLRRISIAFYQQIRALKPQFRANRMRLWWASGRLRRIAAGIAIIGALGILSTLGWQSVGRRPEPAPASEPPAEAPRALARDPFTIQVAAYLKPEDAQLYVDRLKQKNVEAFWTKATGANRTWYQVKVSHFATRDAARTYGEKLKSQGVIDDFYVANYTP
ncbi:MAG: SPOR domain-containing protein [Desulfobacteraceae bacterium]|nr:MAG: SPOR domain-containing protein [Desulfobacteraceae bacterium]